LRHRAAGVLTGLLVFVLLVPAVAVTIARLVPGSGLAWVVLRALTPYVVVPYGMLALLLGWVTVRGEGSTRVASAVAFAGVVLLLGIHLVWAAGPFVGPRPAEATDRSFTVMTVNLHLGRADAGPLVRAVERERVDVLVLEEVTPVALERLRTAGLGDRLRFHAGEARPGRDGTVVLSAHPVLASATLPTRSPGYAVDVAAGGETLRVLAVHPTAPNNGVARWRADLEVVDRVAASSTVPTLVAGDFNATLDHPPLRTLVDRGYRDAVEEARAGWLPTWPALGSVRLLGVTLPPLFALDHVFLRGPLHAVQARSVALPGTDHRALLVDVAWSSDALTAQPSPR
jgi:endonuclease/exonuclease/phosphatase (EEP) superfamily protein YafD